MSSHGEFRESLREHFGGGGGTGRAEVRMLMMIVAICFVDPGVFPNSCSNNTIVSMNNNYYCYYYHHVAKEDFIYMHLQMRPKNLKS